MSSAAPALIRCFVVAVAATVLSAPIALRLRSLANSCVSGCPMHSRQKLHCHSSAAATAAHGQAGRRADCTTAAITPPGCTCGHGAPTLSMPRAVLNAPAAAWAVATRPARRAATERFHTRAADPPDPPPPILCV